MGLLISNIVKIGNGVLPKNLFEIDSDYYLYVLDYANFDFQEMDSYSSSLHFSGMSKILNNYSYSFNNRKVKKMESYTFHSDTIMSWQRIFDIENTDYGETKPARVTPAFLFTTLSPNNLSNLSIDDVPNNEFIFLRIKFKDRDANRVPQLVNEMFLNTGLTISKCRRANIDSKYQTVHIFDYFFENERTEPQIVNNNSFYAGSDMNISDSVIGANNKVTNIKTIEKKAGFWKGVWQNIVSNIIWYIIGVTVAVLLIYLGLR